MSSLQGLKRRGWTWTCALGFWLLGAATAPCGDPPAVEWERRYGTDADDYMPSDFPGNHIQQTADGGYIVVAATGPDILLLKVDSAGTEEWSRTLQGHGRLPVGIHQKADGSYVIGHEHLADATSCFALTQTDPSGNVVWSKTLSPQRWCPLYMQAARDGGYIISGIWWRPDGHCDPAAVRTDSSGKVSWSRTYAGYGDDNSFGSAEQTEDGGYIFGNSRLGLLFKADAQGREVWARTFEVGVGPARQTSDGGYVFSHGGGLTKTDRDGNQQWTKSLSCQGHCNCVRETCDGGYLSLITDGWVGSSRGRLVRTDSQANELWAWGVGVPGFDDASTVIQTKEGAYVVAGCGTGMGRGFDVFLAKLAPDGDCRPGESAFRRGDSDAGGALNLTDAVFTLSYLFRAGPAPGCIDAADADDNGAIQITDAIFTLNHLFLGGPAPSEPFASCGRDGTPDDLGCESFQGCP